LQQQLIEGSSSRPTAAWGWVHPKLVLATSLQFC
jgi:hypothetical protein